LRNEDRTQGVAGYLRHTEGTDFAAAFDKSERGFFARAANILLIALADMLVALFAADPRFGGGRSARTSEAKCVTGWSDALTSTHLSGLLSPHPDARYARIDPPPPGEGEPNA
jgi:hypothetical protein